MKLINKLEEQNGTIIDGKLHLGYKIPKYNEKLIHIEDNDLGREEWKPKAQKHIRTEIFDPWFKNNPFSDEFDPINTHIATIEKACKESIKRRNIATLESELSFYGRLIWNSEIYFNEQAIQPWQKHYSSKEEQDLAISPPILPVCDSLYRVYQYSIQECEMTAGEAHIPKTITDYIYNRCVALCEDASGDVHRISLVNLLCMCKREDQVPYLKAYLDQYLTDLEENFN